MNDPSERFSRQRHKPGDRVQLIRNKAKTGVIRDIAYKGPGETLAFVAWDDGSMGGIEPRLLEREGSIRR